MNCPAQHDTSLEQTQISINLSQFRHFLSWVAPLTMAFALFAALAIPLYGAWSTGIAGMIIGAYGLILVLARKLVHVGRWRTAIGLMYFGLLTAVLVVVPIQPGWFPTLAVVPLLVVALALPYTSHRVFRWLLVGCWLVAFGAIIGGEILSNGILSPLWYERAFRMTSFSAAIGIVLVLLWQFSSRLNETLAKIKAAEERYALAVRGANDGLWDWNLVTGEIYFSPRWKAMLGYEEHEISHTPEEWFKRVHPEDLEALQTAIKAHLDGHTEHIYHEHRVRHRDGSYRWMLSRALAVRNAQGQATRMAGSRTDITDRKRAEERLQHDALHDTLTGLPNRAFFLNRLKRAIERSKGHEEGLFAILFLDLDRFKIINDSLGHHAGDYLLKEIAQRIDGCLRHGDIVARLGGDEFAILLDRLEDVSDAAHIAERIQQTVAVPVMLNGHEMFTSTSIGIAFSKGNYQQAEDMVRDADTAMYRAKGRGKACYEIFDHTMHAGMLALLQLETELRWAVERQEFIVYYQPIVSLESGRITGFEALLRWQHPTGKIIAPAEFLSLAEETGLIIPIGWWMLRETCRQIKSWQDQYSDKTLLTVSINLSNTQFAHPDLVDQVKRILQETGIDPTQVKLEITKGVIMDKDGSATSVVCQLRELGVQLHIDDFGTGYSSLSNLHRIPINGLKIDRSFVSRMSDTGENSEIVQAIITLAHSLGMTVIAEGVETQGHLTCLRDLGCEQGQGYFFAKPVDHMGAEALLATSPRW
jgi:diguanylate cyclase (GGDEF)-like protein/PAS domain S-box-containing protein